jgi:DNA-directed RNA polymerase specialized sigma24 family protein
VDDNELIAALAGGDDTALRELFSAHAPWIAARLRAVLPAAEVEDVLQETFLGAWRGAAGYRGEGVGGWLWGIARRQAALSLRRRGRAEAVLAALAAADDVGAACTQVALMDQGKIVFQGTPDQLTTRGEGTTAAGDAPLERGYSAVLAQARS